MAVKPSARVCLVGNFLVLGIGTDGALCKFFAVTRKDLNRVDVLGVIRLILPAERGVGGVILPS